MKKQLLFVIALIVLIIIADQWLKIYVKTHMELGTEKTVFGAEDEGWFRIHFTENTGMAFGFDLGGDWGKIILSVFRVLAVAAIGWYGVGLIRKGSTRLVRICLALVFAGALGNIIDCWFYGLLFDSGTTLAADGGLNHYYGVSQLNGEGYAPLLHGSVVDMLYFPIIETENFTFFSPVFNIADASISVGAMLIVYMLIQNFFAERRNPKKEDGDEENGNGTDDTAPAAEEVTASPETPPAI